MSEEIYEITTDADGVDCYIKRGNLVRCKDCKHWNDRNGLCKMHSLPLVGAFYGTSEDDYCSVGERKEQEHE